MRDDMKIIIGSCAGAIAALTVLVGLHAAADGLQQSDQVPRVLSYQGTLEKDGIAAEGIQGLRFELLDGSPTSTVAWTEDQDVPVDQGRFSVLLGGTSWDSGAALAAALEAADDLYLRVSVLDNGAWIPLSNPQRFLPVPFSHWAATGSQIAVRGIEGIQNSGTLYLNFHTGATTEVGGDLQVYGPGVRFMAHPDRGDGGSALHHGSGDKLYLNLDQQLSGGTLIQGPLATDPALVRLNRFEMGQSTSYDTGYNVNEWLCTVGGLHFGPGDIDETHADTLMTANTWKNTTTNTWWISADFHSHDQNEDHTIGVVCYRAGIVGPSTNWSGS